MTTDDLLKVILSLNAEDAFQPRLDPGQWRTFLPYLARQDVKVGELLIRHGEVDRTAYWVGQGMLQVFVPGAQGGGKVAILRPGALVGEPGLFAGGERAASVEAMTPSVVWALRLPRFEELCARAPAVALETLRAAGGVMATRLRANLLRQTPMI
jgi:CRP/FNR family cyclic AMP-dependent transcriptional regulator